MNRPNNDFVNEMIDNLNPVRDEYSDDELSMFDDIMKELDEGNDDYE